MNYILVGCPCYIDIWLFLFFLDEPKKANDADDIYGGSTDDDSAELNQSKEIEHVAPPTSKEASSSSDLDTEDELKRSVKYS